MKLGMEMGRRLTQDTLIDSKKRKISNILVKCNDLILYYIEYTNFPPRLCP